MQWSSVVFFEVRTVFWSFGFEWLINIPMASISFWRTLIKACSAPFTLKISLVSCSLSSEWYSLNVDTKIYFLESVNGIPPVYCNSLQKFVSVNVFDIAYSWGAPLWEGIFMHFPSPEGGIIIWSWSLVFITTLFFEPNASSTLISGFNKL